MQVAVSFRTGGRSTDLAVRAATPVSLGELCPRIETLIESPVAGSWWCRGDQLHADSVVGRDLLNGAVIDGDRRGAGTGAVGVLSLQQVGGPGAGRVIPLGPGRFTIGRDPACDVPVADPDASRRHARLEVTRTSVRVHDLQSTNGTRVEGDAVPATGRAVRPDERIRIGDSTFLVTAPTTTPATVRATDTGVLQVLRPPRRVDRPGADVLEVPTPSGSVRPRGVQWAAALVPAAVGAGIAWFAHSPQFLLFALLSPVVMLSTSVGDRVHWRRSRRREAVTYTARRAGAEADIAGALARETAHRHDSAPDPARIALIASLPGTRLWERRRSDADFLTVRLGTADVPSTVCLREGTRTAPAGRLSGVPFCVDLRSGPVGVAGPIAVLDGVARALVGQLAVLHSPAELEFVFLLSREAAWRWCRWLPHWRGDLAITRSDVARTVSELADDVDRRLASGRHTGDGWTGRWRVLVLDRAAEMSDVAGLADLLARGATAGITALCLDDDASALPSACTSSVHATGVTGHRAVVQTHDGRRQSDVVLDAVSENWADELARALGRLVDAGAELASLPDSCALLPVLGLTDEDDVTSLGVPAGIDGGPDPAADLAAAIACRWTTSDGSAAARIGIGADGPLTFDLTADGPHGLIAGTTGAGKSELSRSIVIGMAVDHPPELLNFLLIDYKGGATFAECARLPHCTGLVTDLDPFLTSRALRSLNSELRRRERLFADAGVADLPGFRARRPQDRLPRLVIVVDEFATLADELPDFLRGLVGVAQRGRSLGVHLVLATQRPGSAVTPEIRANTSLRLALRVTDPGESTDVIDAPDASFIDRRLPGRAFLRSGTTLTGFQAAHTGQRIDAADEPVVELLDEWARPLSERSAPSGATELDLLVAAVERAHASGSGERARSTWLPPLERRISRTAAGDVTSGAAPGVGIDARDLMSLPYAVADLPDRQQREMMRLDLRGSSLLVVGAGGSGRTEVLGSLAASGAERLSPAELHLYVIDGDGRLAAAVTALPHAATVVGPQDLDLVPALLQRLSRRGIDAAYGTVAGGAPTPASLLLVDGWDVVSATLSDADALEAADLLATIVRNAARDRISIAVTGGRASLAPRFAANFETKVLLRLSDGADYGMAGISPRSVPSRFVPGRGVRAVDGAEVQLLCVGEQDEPDALCAALRRVAARCVSTAPEAVDAAGRPIRLRPLPTRVLLAAVPAPRAASALILGIGGDDAAPVVLDIAGSNGRFLVAGPPRSGRTTVLRSLLRQARQASLPLAVAAPTRSPLSAAASMHGVALITPEDAASTIESLVGSSTLVLVDDCETFLDRPAGDALLELARGQRPGTMFVAAGRSDELATSYRGIGAHVRRDNCGLLLRPGPVDGELLGTRLPRRPSSGPPGRGVVIGLPVNGDPNDTGEPRAVQVALPPEDTPAWRPPEPPAPVPPRQPMCA